MDSDSLCRVLSIQNISCEKLGTIESLLKADNTRIENILAPLDKIPPDPSLYSALIILGGPVSVYDNLEYLSLEQELIRKAVGLNIPVLGICLGSQLIAKAMGGNVYRGPLKEIGWSTVTITDAGRNDIFRGINDPIMRVFQWHGDSYSLPQEAKVLALSNLYIQAFRIKSAVGIQFHSEIDSEMISKWIAQYSNELKTERTEPARLKINQYDEKILRKQCEIMYGNFFKPILDIKKNH